MEKVVRLRFIPKIRVPVHVGEMPSQFFVSIIEEGHCLDSMLRDFENSADLGDTIILFIVMC